MPAVWRVERKPQIMAEKAIRAMTFAREGARALNTPIWIPREPKLANPQSPYEAIVCARKDRGLFDFMMV